MSFTVKGPDGQARTYARPVVPVILRNAQAEAEALEWIDRYARNNRRAFVAGKI